MSSTTAIAVFERRCKMAIGIVSLATSYPDNLNDLYRVPRAATVMLFRLHLAEETNDTFSNYKVTMCSGFL